MKGAEARCRIGEGGAGLVRLEGPGCKRRRSMIGRVNVVVGLLAFAFAIPLDAQNL